MTYPTTKSGDNTTSLVQNKQSNLIFHPSALVQHVPPPPRRRKLNDILTDANPAMDAAACRTVRNALIEGIWGRNQNEDRLREMYGVEPHESLRRVLADESPLLYSALRDAEIRLGVYIEGLVAAGRPTHIGALIFAANNVANATKVYLDRFHDRMSELIPEVVYSNVDDEFTPVSETEEGEDDPN